MGPVFRLLRACTLRVSGRYVAHVPLQMGIYAALGISQAFTFFMMGATFASLTYFASQALHKQAIFRVMHAPMSFFETTPTGR